MHHDDLSSYVWGVDCSGAVFDAVDVGCYGGPVAADVGVGRELDDTVSEFDTVGLCAEED